MDYTSGCIDDNYFFAGNGISEIVLLQILIYTIPGSQVAPSKGRRDHIYIIGFLHDTEIDGNGGAERINMLNGFFLIRCVKRFFLRDKYIIHFRQIGLKSLDDILYLPHKDACVP